MRKILVAVIDDEIMHSLLIKSALSDIGLNIETLIFHDGQAAYNYLVAHASNKLMLPDYIFLDVEMPEMNGWDFLDKLEAIQETLAKKSIIYINSSSDEHSDKAISHPLVKGYFRKPIEHSKLQAIFIWVSLFITLSVYLHYLHQFC
jgi:two-component system chemotaxis response regulator CheY